MIKYEHAKTILKKAKIKIKDEEILIENSLNRVVAKDILSPSNHPSENNSAFDGFAVNHKDTNKITTKKPSEDQIIVARIAMANCVKNSENVSIFDDILSTSKEVSNG